MSRIGDLLNNNIMAIFPNDLSYTSLTSVQTKLSKGELKSVGEQLKSALSYLQEQNIAFKSTVTADRIVIQKVSIRRLKFQSL